MNQARKLEVRSIIGEAKEVKSIRTKAKVFDDWMTYTRHRQIVFDMEARAQNFLNYNLRRKGLSALFMYKLQRIIDKKVT